MKPVRSRKNQYPGINAHLHSKWQSKSGWNYFHSTHITYLTGALRPALLPLGYTAYPEDALQIRREGEAALLRPRADVLIREDNPLRVYRPRVSRIPGTNRELVAPIPEMLNLSEEDIEYHKAVVVYRLHADDEERGEPVAWIELLSPSNKPGGPDWYRYEEKRENLLHAGIVFVELDYLHESPPTLALPLYGTPENIYPYRIAVVTPRPDFLTGEIVVTQFGVDSPIPAVTIPLLDDDVIDFDFNVPYQKTFEEMLFGNEVDYGQFPLNFDRYNEADKTRIALRMLAVLQAVQSGQSPENIPLEVPSLTLEETLNQINTLKAQLV